MEKISVVIISYNQKDLLKEAIESVLTQTYSPFEIIICDDCSTDGSQKLIQDYETKHPNIIKTFFHSRNLGISKNRNSGIKAATGELVTWLDGDDIFRPKKLELELKQFKKTIDVKWVYSQVIQIDIKQNKITSRYKKFFEGIIFDNVVATLGYAPRNPLVELSALQKIGLFDENMGMYEDFDLCMRLAKNYKSSYCIEPLMEYRIFSNGVHNSNQTKHFKNLQHLHTNFIEIINNDSKKNKQNSKKIFLDQINYAILKKNVEENNFLKSLLYLSKRIFSNPLRIIAPSTFITLINILFHINVTITFTINQNKN